MQKQMCYNDRFWIFFGSFLDRFPKIYFYRIKILQSLMKADFHTVKFLNFGSFLEFFSRTIQTD